MAASLPPSHVLLVFDARPTTDLALTKKSSVHRDNDAVWLGTCKMTSRRSPDLKA